MGKRKPISNFIKTTWTALNIRCCNGKYNHMATESKCKSYKYIKLLFTREEYKRFCLENETLILNLARPSIDRIDNTLNYTLDNIQFIELAENIAKNKRIAKDGMCRCFTCGIVKPLNLFVKDSRRTNGYSTQCKECEKDRNNKRRFQLNRSTGTN